MRGHHGPHGGEAQREELLGQARAFGNIRVPEWDATLLSLWPRPPALQGSQPHPGLGLRSRQDVRGGNL